MTAFEFEFGTGEAAHVIAAEEHVGGARAEGEGIAVEVRVPAVSLCVGAGQSHLSGLEQMARGEGAEVRRRVDAGDVEVRQRSQREKVHKPEVFASLARNSHVDFIATEFVVGLDGYTEVTEPAPPVGTRTTFLLFEGDTELREGTFDFLHGASGGACQLVDGEFEHGFDG